MHKQSLGHSNVFLQSVGQHEFLVNIANADLLRSYMYHGKGACSWVVNHVRSHISICHTLPQVTLAEQSKTKVFVTLR